MELEWLRQRELKFNELDGSAAEEVELQEQRLELNAEGIACGTPSRTHPQACESACPAKGNEGARAGLRYIPRGSPPEPAAW